jgi:hypothetical protein
MNVKRIIISAAVASSLCFSASLKAETINANGKTEIGIKDNGGDLIKVRKLARDSAERDAILSALKLRLNVDGSSAAAKDALGELSKQLTDNLKTTFTVEGDVLIAKTTLSVDSGQLFNLARSIKGLVSTTATAAAKIIFLIDEYYGVSTSIQPGQALETEISYSHDKSAASSSSSSASSSSKSKEAVAISAKDKSAYAESDSAAYAASDKAAFAGKDKAGVAVSNQSGSGAAVRETSVAGASSSSVAAARKRSAAGSSESSVSGAASSEKAEASASASASSSSKNDVVNYSFKQKFPEVGNAKPADGEAALITQRIEQVIKDYGLTYTAERDLRFDQAGKKLTIGDIEKKRLFEQFTEKASKQPFSAKYIVYGTSVMSAEGKTASGDVTCSGLLKLSSFSVDSGDGLASATLGKRAQGSSDQDCRTNLATALATELAKTVGNVAARELQLAAIQGQSFYVTLYSNQRVIPSVRRSFTKKLESMVEKYEEDNVTDNSRTFVVQAKTGFRSKLEDFVDDLAEDNKEAMKGYKMVAKGNRVVICLEGICPKDF